VKTVNHTELNCHVVYTLICNKRIFRGFVRKKLNCHERVILGKFRTQSRQKFPLGQSARSYLTDHPTTAFQISFLTPTML